VSTLLAVRPNAAAPDAGSFNPVRSGLLQRKCACGGTPGPSGECAECRKKRLGLQRRSAGGSEPSAIPPIVHDTLRSSGHALDPAPRAFMESRFGHDFSQVRVHTDAKAAASARAVNALAYTVGRDVVFDTGRYAPGSSEGLRLLAHELTHVVQQRARMAAPQPLLALGRSDDQSEREADRVAGALVTRDGQADVVNRSAPTGLLQRRSIFKEFAGLFRGDEFEMSELHAHLAERERTNRIEDFTDSDNKARAIVNQWKRGDSPFELTPKLKILLIKEMQSGFTGDDDERAILELLERSSNAELSAIFGSGGVNPRDLNSDFHGDEWTRLQDFYFRRFDGGMVNVLAGVVAPKGEAVPLGAPLPVGPPRPVGISEPGEARCTADERQSLARINLCCTESMLEEIGSLRAQAVPVVYTAARKLSSAPDDVSGPLWDHFRVRPDDRPRILVIVHQLELMVGEMTRDDVKFACRDWMIDPMCFGIHASTSPTCTSSRPVYIHFCGDYEFGETRYLSGGHWLKTLIHEYAHAACPGTSMIRPAGSEFYRGKPGYPPESPDVAVRNADSYANFALEAQ